MSIPTISRLGLFRRLITHATPYWPGFTIAFIAMIVVAATEAAFPAMMKPLLDNGFQNTSSFQVWWVPTAVLAIFVIRGIANFIVGYLMQWIANNVLRDLRGAMFAKLLLLPATFFDRSSSGRLISKLVSEVHIVLIVVTNVVTVAVRDLLVLLGLIAWLTYLNWQLSLIVFALIPALALLSINFSRRLRNISKSHLSTTGEMTSIIEEAISGYRVIKIFDGSNYEETRFKKVNSRYRRQAMRLAILQSLQSPVTQLIVAFGVAAILTIALIQSRLGSNTVGDFVSFITAMLMMFGPIRHLTDINSQLQRGLVAADSIFSFIDEKTELDIGTKQLNHATGSIQFSNVSLLYTERDLHAVRDFTLEIAPRSMIALVGPSGCGKTSVVNMLMRIYEHSAGDIFIDQISIRDLSLKSLRKQFALVSQDVVLFNDTIYKNISYGREDLTPADVWNALNAADLANFIQSLPQGLETIVGDRGIRVSGGQRQRIAIARAILKNAPILILDEATSALDSTSEENIKSAINALRRDRTTIVIAHRLSTVVDADQIIVMEQGRIIQKGRHDHLVREPGLYQNLYLKLITDTNSASDVLVNDPSRSP